MKERGLLMTSGNAQQILADVKTRTRRIMDVQPQACHRISKDPGGSPSGWSLIADAYDDEPLTNRFGKPGDRLWIREDHYRIGHWELVPGVLTKGGRPKWRFVADREDVLFEFARPFLSRVKGHEGESLCYKRLGRFMPRSLCRLVVEVVDVRPCRLQDITDAQAIAEGVHRRGEEWKDYTNVFGTCLTPRASFRTLWQSINRMDSWDQNPWVWDVSFRRVPGAEKGDFHG